MADESNVLTEYKAALHGTAVLKPGTAIHKYAEDIVRELAGRAVVYKVECVLCRQEFDFTVSVKTAAEWIDTPRGICGNHPVDEGDDNKPAILI